MISYIEKVAQDGETYVIELRGDKKAASMRYYDDYAKSYRSALTKKVVLTLRGDGVTRTLTLTGTGPLLWVSDGVGVTLEHNVTLKGGASPNDTALAYVSGGGRFTMTGGVIRGNAAHYSGGGVAAVNAVFTMTGGEIRDNVARDYGGGVYFNGTGTPALSGGAVAGNEAYKGGGIYVYGGALTLSGGAKISGNAAARSGGGVYFDGAGTLEVPGGAIRDNRADDGGGIYVLSGALALSGGLIEDNTARASGGGVEIAAAVFTMSNGEICGNMAKSYGYGGGLYVGSGGAFTMTGGKIRENAAVSGGGAYVSGGGLSFVKQGGGEIGGNTASGKGAAVFVNDGAGKRRDAAVNANDTLKAEKSGARWVYAGVWDN